MIIDIKNTKSTVNLVKDVIAFANADGGYIVIGINDKRQIVGLPQDFHIDEAELRDKICKYTATPINFEYREFEKKIGGKRVKLAVLYVLKSEKPVFIKRNGEYEIGKKKKSVFRKGDIIYRVGSESKILREPEDLVAFFEHFVSNNFQDREIKEFEKVTNDVVHGIESKTLQHYEFTEKIDKLISIFKTAIDDWDSKKVKYYTEVLFEKFSPYYGEKEEENTVFPSLYPIFNDLFIRAYKERRHILGVMISTFNLILLKLWTKSYSERKIRCCVDLLLRLVIDFFEKDVDVAKDCLIALSNGARDIFMRETLGSLILLGAKVYNATKNAENKKYIDLKDKISENIDAIISENISSNFEYLVDSVMFAISASDKYDIFVEEYIKNEILPTILRHIESFLDEFCNEILESTDDEHIDYTLGYFEELITNWISLSEILLFDLDIANLVIKMIKKCISNETINSRTRKKLLSFLKDILIEKS